MSDLDLQSNAVEAVERRACGLIMGGGSRSALGIYIAQLDTRRQHQSQRLFDHIARNSQHCVHTLPAVTYCAFPFKRNRMRCVRFVNENRKKRKRVGKQSIMVATASTEHSYWLALAFVASRNKRKRQPIRMLGQLTPKI